MALSSPLGIQREWLRAFFTTWRRLRNWWFLFSAVCTEEKGKRKKGNARGAKWPHSTLATTEIPEHNEWMLLYGATQDKWSAMKWYRQPSAQQQQQRPKTSFPVYKSENGIYCVCKWTWPQPEHDSSIRFHAYASLHQPSATRMKYECMIIVQEIIEYSRCIYANNARHFFACVRDVNYPLNKWIITRKIFIASYRLHSCIMPAVPQFISPKILNYN